MNHKTEATRLAGCREMEHESFAREIEMALENAVDSKLERAEFAIERMQALSQQRMGLRLPLDTSVKEINSIANDYIGRK